MWRTRASKVVVGVAALACVATSQPRWQIDVPMPALPQPGAAQAVQLTVDATRAPDIACESAEPVYAVDAAGRIAPVSTHAIYLCQPGAAVLHVALSGTGGGGCGSPKPPADVSIQLAEARVVPVWTKTIDVPFALVDGGVMLDLVVAYPYTIDAARDAGGAMFTTRWPKRVLVNSADGRGGPSHARVTLYGACADAACTPPDDATATVTVSAVP
jgi:hypothetical protein